MLYDAFICHASEDKDDFVRPLAEALRSHKLKVWYDEFALNVGDSLREAIDRGLRSSRFGIVVLSPHFFQKHWTVRELNGLVARETAENCHLILPVWHNVGREDVLKFSPPLADLLATSSKSGVRKVVADLLRTVRPEENHLVVKNDKVDAIAATAPNRTAVTDPSLEHYKANVRLAMREIRTAMREFVSLREKCFPRGKYLESVHDVRTDMICALLEYLNAFERLPKVLRLRKIDPQDQLQRLWDMYYWLEANRGPYTKCLKALQDPKECLKSLKDPESSEEQLSAIFEYIEGFFHRYEEDFVQLTNDVLGDDTQSGVFDTKNPEGRKRWDYSVFRPANMIFLRKRR